MTRLEKKLIFLSNIQSDVFRFDLLFSSKESFIQKTDEDRELVFHFINVRRIIGMTKC